MIITIIIIYSTSANIIHRLSRKVLEEDITGT